MRSNAVSYKHYLWLLLWGSCLYYGIKNDSLVASIAFLFIFFAVSTYKRLFKSFLIGLVCAIVAFIPGVNLIFMVLGFICILLRIKFLIDHWRVLFVGVYAYGVHFLLLMGNSFRKVKEGIENVGIGANLIEVEMAQSATSTVSDAVTYTGLIVAIIMTIIFHLMIKWLYSHNYSTERAFLIMGLSPLIVGATIFPFLSHLKVGDIDITGDSFLDADSFDEAADSLTGTETGLMGAAAHGTNTLASDQEQDNEKQPIRQKNSTLKLCPNCGKELGVDERFCTKCGAKYEAPIMLTMGNDISSETSIQNFKICSNCGKELGADERFCTKCGTKYEAPIMLTIGSDISSETSIQNSKICSNCGKELGADERFCTKCGTKYSFSKFQ